MERLAIGAWSQPGKAELPGMVAIEGELQEFDASRRRIDAPDDRLDVARHISCAGAGEHQVGWAEIPAVGLRSPLETKRANRGGGRRIVQGHRVPGELPTVRRVRKDSQWLSVGGGG